MRTYMARLGGFEFGLDTAAFQSLQRQSSYRWQAQERIGRKPAQQLTGQGADTISLSGVIYPHYRGGLGQVGRLRDQAGLGEPLPFVYADELAGQFLGLWCVTEVGETRTVFFEDGTPRKIEFSLSLVEYGDDTGAAAITAPAAAFAGLVDAPSAAAATASAAATAAVGSAAAIAAAPAVAAASTATAGGISGLVDSIVNNDAVSIARRAAGDLSSLVSAAEQMRQATDLVRMANGNPTAIISALSGAAGSADIAVRELNRITAAVTGQSAVINGSSPGSLYAQQAGQLATQAGGLVQTAGIVSRSARTIVGILGG